MKAIRLIGPVLVFCLCLLLVSTAYAKKPPIPEPEPAPYITYHGYAVLENGYDIVSDRGNPYLDPYVDRDLVSVRGNPNNRRGDKIQVQLKYDPDSNKYDLWFFRCFMGKPELPWRSPRRVRLNNVVLSDSNKGSAYDANSTVADMLRYTVEGFFDNSPTPRNLADGSVHLSVAKGWWDDEAQVCHDVCWSTFLVDQSCEGEEVDPNAITQPNLWYLDSDAPRYYTSLEGSSFGSEEDPHGHIGFFIFEGQLEFTPIGHEPQKTTQGIIDVPITWEVTPISPDGVAIRVRDLSNYVGNDDYPNDVVNPPAPFDTPPVGDAENAREIWKDIGLSFRLIVSRDIDFPTDESQAPRRDATLTSTWGAVKGK